MEGGVALDPNSVRGVVEVFPGAHEHSVPHPLRLPAGLYGLDKVVVGDLLKAADARECDHPHHHERAHDQERHGKVLQKLYHRCPHRPGLAVWPLVAQPLRVLRELRVVPRNPRRPGIFKRSLHVVPQEEVVEEDVRLNAPSFDGQPMHAGQVGRVGHPGLHRKSLVLWRRMGYRFSGGTPFLLSPARQPVGFLRWSCWLPLLRFHREVRLSQDALPSSAEVHKNLKPVTFRVQDQRINVGAEVHGNPGRAQQPKLHPPQRGGLGGSAVEGVSLSPRILKWVPQGQHYSVLIAALVRSEQQHVF
eukprot:RCo045719